MNKELLKLALNCRK